MNVDKPNTAGIRPLPAAQPPGSVPPPAAPADKAATAQPAAASDVRDAAGVARPDALDRLIGEAPGAAPGGEADLDAAFGQLDGPAARAEALAKQPLLDAAAQAELGGLAADLAAQGEVPADVLDAVAKSGPATRAFLAGLPADRAAAILHGQPADARRAMLDALGTDGGDRPQAAALTRSLMTQDPALAHEVLDWGGEGLARAVAQGWEGDLPPGFEARLGPLRG